MDSEDIRPVEIEVSGETIYREKIKALVEPAENGKFVVIDVESGDYEIDEDALTASTRLRERRPHGVNYGIRVGYRTAFSLGGGLAHPMLRGLFDHDLKPRVSLEMIGESGQVHSIEVVLDTGFNGDLTLPPDTIRRLGLAKEVRYSATLANGMDVYLDGWKGTAHFHGQPRNILVLESGGEPLLGMNLLRGN